MATAPLLAPQASFYKRPLPASCVPFNSQEGKTLFAKALNEGNMEGYFTLAGSLETQQDPAFCGLGTLCSILNALEVDPQRKWRGAWRYYDQSMLDCCRPLADVSSVGLTLSEFVCLARCNGLRARLISPVLSASPSALSSAATPLEALDAGQREEGLKRFREDVRQVARGKGAMAISYSRRTLGQTGDGHFSPLGGYCQKEDKVLILDVARFKYPSYWIPLSLAYDSLFPIDKATGQPRGYVLLDVAGEEPGSLAAPLSLTSLTLNKSSYAALSQSLSRLLLGASKSAPSAPDLLSTIMTHLSGLATPALAARPSTSSESSPQALPHLLDTLSTTRLASLTSFASAPNPNATLLNLLLFLALFSPRSSLAALLPPSAAPELRALMDEALQVEGVREETDVLLKMVQALSECCRNEEEGAGACGCASKGAKAHAD
ncbi:hypothetical protein JCM10213_008950 [Rhodosporidiobolus nylandii]